MQATSQARTLPPGCVRTHLPTPYHTDAHTHTERHAHTGAHAPTKGHTQAHTHRCTHTRVCTPPTGQSHHPAPASQPPAPCPGSTPPSPRRPTASTLLSPLAKVRGTSSSIWNPTSLRPPRAQEGVHQHLVASSVLSTGRLFFSKKNTNE